jgi:hypothetical protein
MATEFSFLCDFPFLQLFRKKRFFQVLSGIECWKLVFGLPAAREIGGEILFRLRILIDRPPQL